MEFEWIRQYWVQGAEHDRTRKEWQGPMQELERMWMALEVASRKCYDRAAVLGSADLTALRDGFVYR